MQPVCSGHGVLPVRDDQSVAHSATIAQVNYHEVTAFTSVFFFLFPLSAIFWPLPAGLKSRFRGRN